MRGRKNSRRKGNQAEVYYRNIFINDLGFSDCKTSRHASKLLDDAGIDLVGIPYNVQIKRGYNNSMNYLTTMLDLYSKINTNLPREMDHIKKRVTFMIHERDMKRTQFGGQSKPDYETLVCMSSNDYNRLASELSPTGNVEQQHKLFHWNNAVRHVPIFGRYKNKPANAYKAIEEEKLYYPSIVPVLTAYYPHIQDHHAVELFFIKFVDFMNLLSIFHTESNADD